MNDKPHMVVGVLPPVPQYPLEVDLYMPSSACPFRSNPTNVENRGFRLLTAFARVRPEVTLQKSQADLDIAAAQMQKAYKETPQGPGFRAAAVPLKTDLTSNFTSTLWILLGTAGFVLLIVCASIANLLLARMVRREREISVRAALGATRARLLRQLLTESLLLAVSGGVLGLVLSALSLRLLVNFAAKYTPRAQEIGIDLNVLFFTLGVSVFTGLIFGSIPAFARRFDVAPALREGGRSTHSGQKVRSALIVAQVSASFMLLIAAGLTLRSLMTVQNVNPGIRTENLISWRADMSFDKFPLTMPPAERRPKVAAYWTEYEARLRAIPGVLEVAGGGTFPLNEIDPFPQGLIRDGHPLPPETKPPLIDVRFATSEYFKTLGQPIVNGRAFMASDTLTAPGVAIVNQTAAKQFWPNEDPVGTRIAGGGPGQFRTIVGVVADVRQQLDRPAKAEVYVPVAQTANFGTTWVVHSKLPLEELTRQIKTVSHAHDSDLPVSSFRTLAEVRSEGLAPRRVVVSLIGMFGLLALIITAAGIAGVIAFSVNQRTHEFGIRVALGAQRSRVLGQVLREGLVLVTIGLAIGLAGAFVLTKLVGSVIFEQQTTAGLRLLIETHPTDAATYIGVALILVLVAVAACLMPARRAATVDPMVALRAQ
jgi:putative ABC transport system permease protein